jgi:hypothetical protein
MSNININDLTLGQIKEIQAMTSTSVVSLESKQSSPFQVGQKWLFRTVTHIDIGEIIAIHGELVVLKDAAWIPDTGRFNEALKDQSKFNEVEPYNDICVVNTSALIDATPVTELQTVVK